MEDPKTRCDVVFHAHHRHLENLFEQCTQEHLIEELEEDARQIQRSRMEDAQVDTEQDEDEDTEDFDEEELLKLLAAEIIEED